MSGLQNSVEQCQRQQGKKLTFTDFEVSVWFLNFTSRFMQPQWKLAIVTGAIIRSILFHLFLTMLVFEANGHCLDFSEEHVVMHVWLSVYVST